MKACQHARPHESLYLQTIIFPVISQVVSKLSDTSASTSTATHVEIDVLTLSMNACIVGCDL